MTAGERKVLRAALVSIEKAGWTVTGVSDGETVETTATIDAALDVVDSVDDSRIKVTGSDGARSWLQIVRGNAKDGSEIIADHGVNLSEALAGYYAMADALAAR